MEWYFCLPSLLLSCNISFSDSFFEFEEKRIFKRGPGKIFYSIWQMREREREKSINDIDIYYPDLNHFASRFSFLKIEEGVSNFGN